MPVLRLGWVVCGGPAVTSRRLLKKAALSFQRPMNALPETIGRYQVRRELGRGMMGVVYLARDPDLGRDIALKVIQLPTGANEADRAGFEQRFFSEAQSAARLSHPGIVVVHDVGRDTGSGSLYMALQVLPGQTLESLLKEKKALDWRESLRITQRVAEALQHAHSEGVVHRDIKPANIMILPSGEPRIMDFGIAKLETSRLTATGQFLGTPLYMSPEQAMANPVDGRSDLFSLGSVLYEMLTGVRAFAGDSVTRILFQLMSQEPAPASSLVASLSPSIDNILKRCLAKDANLRYKDAESLAKDLGDVLDGRTPRSLLALSEPEAFVQTLKAGPAISNGPATQTGQAPPPWSAAQTWALRGSPHVQPRQAAVLATALLLTFGVLAWLSRWLEPAAPVVRPVTDSRFPPVPGTNTAETPEPQASPAPPIRETSQAARVVLDFEHSLRGGLIRVYVDDEKVVERPLSGRVTRKILGIEMRKGRFTETFPVAPGQREIRIQVSWDDNVRTERSGTRFNPGSSRRLKASLGSIGGLRKNLSLEWQ